MSELEHVSLKPMAESLAGGGGGSAGAAIGKASRTPTDIAEEGFAGGGHEVPHRKEMEASFGTDFSGVRAHTGSAAQQASSELGAHAFAAGNQVAFENSNPSQATVAHELTHVLQHSGGDGPARKASGGGPEGIDTSGEAEAERVESAVGAGKPASSVLSNATASSAKGPALKAHGRQAPALDSKFAMGMTFSTSALEKTYEYELWKAHPPIEIPIPAVPGLNFMCEPGVKVVAAGGVNWHEKALKTGLGVEGNVQVGFSYGNASLASVYAAMEAKANGGFEYEKSKDSWSLAGRIALQTDFRVGVKLAGGVLDYGFEFGKVELGQLTGVRWENGKFQKDKLGWEWGAKPKEFFAAMKAAIEKAKRLMSAAGDAAEAAYKKAKQTAKNVYHAGQDAVNWVTSW